MSRIFRKIFNCWGNNFFWCNISGIGKCADFFHGGSFLNIDHVRAAGILEILMFNPKYRVLITSKCFPGDIVVCLGKQLISIIKLVENFLSQHMWYGADVEAVGKGASEPNYKNIQLSMIGTDSQFVEYCCTIEQFIWGEFVCISSEFLFQDIKNIELVTEDKPFRSIGCDGVLMEIRAFDTTYFGIYSEDLELIKKIANKYNLEFECSPIYLEQE